MKTHRIIANEYAIRNALVSHMGRLWRFGLVLSRQRDVAENLVHATCLRALERAKQFQPDTHLDRWLFAILHSIWIDEVLSRQVRKGQCFGEASAAPVLDGIHDAETRPTLADQVLRKVDALPDPQRAAVFLTYVEGFSYREVANLLGIPIGAVMSRLATARVKLAGDPDPDPNVASHLMQECGHCDHVRHLI